MNPLAARRAASPPSALLAVLLAVLLAAGLVAGCAGTPPAPGGRPIPILEPAPPAAKPAPAAPAVLPPLLPAPVPSAEPLPPVTTNFPRTLAAAGAGAPVLALARQAEAARAAGQLDAALGHWQRALRIEPGNAFVWHAIAETHLALKRGDQAESAAQKSTTLARGNLWLEAQNWRLVAAACRLQFDSAGAEAASANYEALRARLPP